MLVRRRSRCGDATVSEDDGGRWRQDVWNEGGEKWMEREVEQVWQIRKKVSWCRVCANDR